MRKNQQFLCYKINLQAFDALSGRLTRPKSIFGVFSGIMGKRLLFIAFTVFCFCANVYGSSPFEKGAKIEIGSGVDWQIRDRTLTRTGSDQGIYYHLFYDRKQVRLRITNGPEDSEANAKVHKQFTIEDVLIDGKRLPLFQWCLTNQERHARFLQQGLSVSKNVCQNKGEVGTFIMRLNKATRETIEAGKQLSFRLKPFRSSLTVSFDISDLSGVVASLHDDAAGKQAKASIEPEKKCLARPPADYPKIKSIEYSCNDKAAQKQATASIATLVEKERQRLKAAAEERKRQQKIAEQNRQKELASQKAREEQLAAEKAAIEDSEAKQAAISSEIANKMIAVCKKKWAQGEHRCYCEKYIEHAPKAIQESSTCSGS